MRWDVANDDGAGANNGTVSDSDSLQDGGIRSDEHGATNGDRA